jgi:hypothetical protein
MFQTAIVLTGVRFPRLGACLRHEAEIAAASTEICHLTPGIA